MNQKGFNYLMIILLVIAIALIITTKIDFGHNPTTTIPTTTVQIIPSFTDNDLNQGWYYGNLDQNKPGTPRFWLHKFEGTRSATWFNPVTRNEGYCTAILRESENTEKSFSKFCNSNDDCISKNYIGSLTNAVKCFSKTEQGLVDYDYAFNLYRELSCGMSMGGAPYSAAYCECINSVCIATLKT